MKFEWDPGKSASNRRRHGLEFGEVSALFTAGALLLVRYDEEHSVSEDRFTVIGSLARGVVHVTISESEDDVTRIISARPATGRERREYERHLRGRAT